MNGLWDSFTNWVNPSSSTNNSGYSPVIGTVGNNGGITASSYAPSGYGDTGMSYKMASTAPSIWDSTSDFLGGDTFKNIAGAGLGVAKYLQGNKQLGLQQDAFDFAKDSWAQNFGAQAKLANNKMRKRWLNRNPGADAGAQNAYMNTHGIGKNIAQA